MILKKILLWVLAVILSLSAMVYQRMTGPTYEKRYEITFQGEDYKFALPRSHGGETDCPVSLELPEPFEAKLIWRKFPTEHAWDTLDMERSDSLLTASLPHQPPAGKLEYHLELSAGGQFFDLHEEENVVIRFKGEVPTYFLVPHVLMMILSMIWSCAVLLFLIFRMPSYKRLMGWAIIFLLLGGFVLGPIVQKFSFGAFWTGWPFGGDLTDNKTLAALVVYLLAWFLRNKKYGKWLAVLAVIVMWAVYLIPHSMRGSTLDHDSGAVVTGSAFYLLALLQGRRQELKRKEDALYL